MRARRSASLCVLVASTLVVVAVPSTAHATTWTATGARCTIVGTRGPDTLSGTPGRDVICGLGGNDRINGRGGNDIIDAGAGDDVVDGGAGADRIFGGAGNDSLYGRSGADLVRGGPGRDRLQGDAGSDRISGDTGSDTASGGIGDDVITGGDGNDRLAGAAGADRIYGEAGNDVQTGGDGNDVVTGGIGDDDLSGGAGGDNVDGGSGFNVCDTPSAVTDKQVRCAVDQSAPEVAEVSPSRSTVDVSAAAQVLRIEAHVTDDTGVKSVQIGNVASLVSGTLRDGVWATTISVPRYITPGPRDVDVFVRDRVGRSTMVTRTNVYTVIDTVSDHAMPVLQSLSLSTSAVDVRSASKSITATIHVTDDLAGATDVYLCPAHMFPSGTPRFRQADGCAWMQQTSGTRTNSTWSGTYLVPKGAPSGTWDFEVWISDAAGNAAEDFWLGPDEIASMGPTNEPRYRTIPDGQGVFTVQGTAQDANAPVLTSFALTPSVVDTTTGAVQVTAEITGTDIEGMTGADLFISGYAGYPDNQTWTDWVDIAWVQNFQLVSGTPKNGVWRATFVVPGGTPNGTYFIQAVLEDSAHFESWVSPDSGWTNDNHLLTTGLAPAGNHLVVDNS